MKKKTEKNFMDAARMAVQALGARMFRNNNGVARFEKKGKAHIVRYGLGTGTSDLIGWTPVIVTHEMIGTEVAIFTALEGKKNPSDKLSEEQASFIRAVSKAGGIAGEFRDADQAMALVTQQADDIQRAVASDGK